MRKSSLMVTDSFRNVVLVLTSNWLIIFLIFISYGYLSKSIYFSELVVHVYEALIIGNSMFSKN